MTLRSQKVWPSDPTQYLQDYFGNERSSAWNQMDDFKDKNEEIQQELPEMELELEEIQNKLAAAKRKTKVIALFKKNIDNATMDVKTLV